ncbi:hypothetical protein D3C76_346230 [compost metagenome]
MLQRLQVQLHRVVAVAQGRNRLLPQVLQQGLHGLLRVEFGAVDLGADEKTYQLLGFAAVAPGAGHAEGELPLAAVAAQQHLPGGQGDDEGLHALLPAELQQGLEHLGVQLQAMVAGTGALRRHASAARVEVTRQHQRLQFVTQPGMPVAGRRLARIALQVSLALPDGVIGILDGGPLQLAGSLGGCLRIGAEQVLQQDRIGPGV